MPIFPLCVGYPQLFRGAHEVDSLGLTQHGRLGPSIQQAQRAVPVQFRGHEPARLPNSGSLVQDSGKTT